MYHMYIGRSRYFQQCNNYKARSIEIYMIRQSIKPDLLKIDVEGGEYECIKSLKQKVDCLCFEWAAEMNDITYKCLEYLSVLGFTKFYIQIQKQFIIIKI